MTTEGAAGLVVIRGGTSGGRITSRAIIAASVQGILFSATPPTTNTTPGTARRSRVLYYAGFFHRWNHPSLESGASCSGLPQDRDPMISCAAPIAPPQRHTPCHLVEEILDKINAERATSLGGDGSAAAISS